MIRESKTNPAFPSEKTYRRFGGKANLLKAVAAFCRANAEFEDVLPFCENGLANQSADEEGIRTGQVEVGYVYLLRHGSRREYKIGRTTNPIRRATIVGPTEPESRDPCRSSLPSRR